MLNTLLKYLIDYKLFRKNEFENKKNANDVDESLNHLFDRFTNG